MPVATVSPDFNNTELAFKAKSQARLLRTYWIYKLIDNPFLTKVGPPMLSAALRMGLPVQGLVRDTLFEVFCGGESLPETAATSRYLHAYGVKTILDYSVEGEKNEAGFDATCQEIEATLLHGGQMDEVAFSACKLTGLASFDLMEKMQRGEALSPDEQVSLDRVRARLDRLASTAAAQRTPLFIDAEESWIQDTIDMLAEEVMARYNTQFPCVYTTVQLYRHDRLAYLENLIRRSREQGYILGVKLVRGAYLERENDRAAQLGYPTPMQPDKDSTDRDYDAALRLCVEHIDHVAICAGTHNEASSLYLTQLMADRGLPPDHPHVWFAQLLGMSDHISFNLAHHGYQAAKYLPYGPVKAVMPYLIRRANENTSIAGQSSREMELLSRELRRRQRTR
ncbi:MAG: proline dehydrogenase family protein [Bacteroidia bacterium]|nr:proline dehydrogenase family protein [Bacteroidia bacterium]